MDTPKSSRSEMQEMLYRISQLEHLMVTSSLTAPSNSFSPNSTTLTQHSLIERISQLEGLLAASELENKNLCDEIQLLSATKNRDEVEFTESISAYQREISDLKYDVQLLELKYSKSNGRIESMKTYINSLPSKEELDEAKETIIQLESENHSLINETDSLKNEIGRLQMKLLEKDSDHQKAVIRLKELEPLEEAQQEYLNKSWNDRVCDYSDENAISQLFTVQKAQIIRCGKIISSLRNKVTAAENVRADLEIEMANKNTETDSLNQQLVGSKIRIDNLLQKIKFQEQERNCLQSECEKLRTDMERKDNFLHRREEEMEYLMQLATEVDVCMNDLSKLIELGESIAHGEEPSVDTLIGIPNQPQLSLVFDNCQETDDSISNGAAIFNSAKNLEFGEAEKYSISQTYSSTGNEDPEWILERLKNIRDMRKSIEKLRNQLVDLYTDILEGSTDACNVQ